MLRSMPAFALALAPALAVVLSVAAPTGVVAQGSHAAKSAPGSATDGQVVFQHTCVMCHSTQPGVKIVGPSLASVLRGPHAGATHAVHEIILNGKGKMPAEKGKLSDQQMADLLAYLRTL